MTGLPSQRAVVLMEQREGRAGDFVGLGGVEGLGDAFDQRGFAGAEIAAQKQELGRLEQPGELASHLDGVRAALGGELVILAFGGGCGVGHRSSLARVPLDDSALQPNIPVGAPGTKAKSLRKFAERVGGEQRVLVGRAHGQIRGQAVEVDGGFDGARGIAGILCQKAGDEAGEQIAAAAFGHGRIAGGVDGDAAIGMRDERARAFEHQRDAVLLAKLRADPRRLACTSATVVPARRAISPGCGVSTSVRPACRGFASLASRTGLAARILRASASMTAGISDGGEQAGGENLTVSGLCPRPGPMASTVMPAVRAATAARAQVLFAAIAPAPPDRRADWSSAPARWRRPRARTGAGTAAVTRPAPARSAASEVMAGAPALPTDPPTTSDMTEVALVGRGGAGRLGERVGRAGPL